jgi:hypothetical protein
MSHQHARQLDDVWTRYLAGDPLDRKERIALTEAVRSDDVFHRRLLHDLRLDGALRAAALGEAQGESFVKAVRARAAASERYGKAPGDGTSQETAAPISRRSWRAFRTLVLAACALAVVGVLAFLGGGPSSEHRRAGGVAETTPSARAGGFKPVPSRTQAARMGWPGDVSIEAVEGPAQVHGRDGRVRSAAEGGIVEAGEWLATVGPHARVRTEHRDGTSIEIGGDTVATGFETRPGTGRLFIARGRIRVSLPGTAPVPALEAASPHAVVTADGCFALEVSATETRVEVQRRRVRVDAIGTGQRAEVRAGQFALARSNELLPAIPIAAARSLLLVVGSGGVARDQQRPALEASDALLRQRLEARGFTVTAMTPGTSLRARASRASLIVLSPTGAAAAADLGAALGDLTVPVLVLDANGAAQLGLTDRRSPVVQALSPGTPARRVPVAATGIVIDKPAHPLAAGLSGPIPLLSARARLASPTASPVVGATVVGRRPGEPGAAVVLFAYERAGPMGAVSAPARRVALLLGDQRATAAVTEQGWRLFEAAASWCAADRP